MNKKAFSSDNNEYDPESFSYDNYDEEKEGKKLKEMLENANQNETDECISDNAPPKDNLEIDDPIEKSKREEEKEEAAERHFDKFTS